MYITRANWVTMPRPRPRCATFLTVNVMPYGTHYTTSPNRIMSQANRKSKTKRTTHKANKQAHSNGQRMANTFAALSTTSPANKKSHLAATKSTAKSRFGYDTMRALCCSGMLSVPLRVCVRRKDTPKSCAQCVEKKNKETLCLVIPTRIWVCFLLTHQQLLHNSATFSTICFCYTYGFGYFCIAKTSRRRFREIGRTERVFWSRLLPHLGATWFTSSAIRYAGDAHDFLNISLDDGLAFICVRAQTLYTCYWAMYAISEPNDRGRFVHWGLVQVIFSVYVRWLMMIIFAWNEQSYNCARINPTL